MPGPAWGTDLLVQPGAVAEEDRHEMDPDLVDVPGLEQLARDINPAHAHVRGPGGRAVPDITHLGRGADRPAPEPPRPRRRPTRMSLRLLCVALAVVSTLAACGGGEPEQAPPADGDEPIVLIDRRAGLAPAAAEWALPGYVLLADGAAIVRAPDQGIVLSATRRTLSAAQVADMFRRAGGADLFRSRTYQRNVVDGTALVVRITSNKGHYETTVVQPGPDESGDRGRVTRFAATAPRVGEPAGAYEPDRVAAVVVAGSDDTSDVRPWPLTVPATGMPGFPSRPCLIIDGPQVPALLASARTATIHTRWSADGSALSLRIRPLLPYEHRCDDLHRG